jgi:hypothetical protein
MAVCTYYVYISIQSCIRKSKPIHMYTYKYIDAYYIDMYVHIHTCKHTYIKSCMYKDAYIYIKMMYTCMYALVYVYTYTHPYIYMNICIYLYTCMYTYLYEHIYIDIYSFICIYPSTYMHIDTEIPSCTHIHTFH